MIEWIPVSKSEFIVAEAYDAETETIYLRFKKDAEWWFAACPPDVWEEYSAPGQSRGQYFNRVLKFKPNGRHGG
jgi:KTSC domain-containing protein